MAGIGDITGSLLGAGASSLLGKVAPFADAAVPGTGRIIKTIATFASLKDLKPSNPAQFKNSIYGTRPTQATSSDKKPADSSILKMMNAFSDITNRIEAKSNEHTKYFQQIVTRLETISSKISETNKLLELGFKQRIEYDRKESASARKARDVYLAEILAGRLSKTITQLRRLQIEPVSAQALQLSLTRAFAGVPWLKGLLGSQSMFYKLASKEGRFTLLAQRNLEELSKNLYKIQQLMIAFNAPNVKNKKADDKYKKVLITKLDEVKEGIISMEQAIHTIAMNIFNPKAMLGKIFWGFIGLTFAKHLYLKYLSPLLKESMKALRQTSAVIFKGIAAQVKPIAAGVIGSISSFMKTVLPDSMYQSLTAMTDRVFTYQKDLYDKMFGDTKSGGGLKATIQNAMVGAAMKIWDMLKPFVGVLMAYQSMWGMSKRIATGDMSASGGVLDIGTRYGNYRLGDRYRSSVGGKVDFAAVAEEKLPPKLKEILSSRSSSNKFLRGSLRKLAKFQKIGPDKATQYEQYLIQAIEKGLLLWNTSTASDPETLMRVFKELPAGSKEKMAMGRYLHKLGISQNYREVKKIRKLQRRPWGRTRGVIGSVMRGTGNVLDKSRIPGVAGIGRLIAGTGTAIGGGAMPAGFGMMGKVGGLLKTGLGAAAAFSPYLLALPLLTEGVKFIGQTVVPYLIHKFVGPRADDKNLSFTDRIAFMVRDIIWGLVRTAFNLVGKAIRNISKIPALAWGIIKGVGKALFTGIVDLAKSAIIGLFPWLGKWIKLDKTSEYEKWKADQEKREAGGRSGGFSTSSAQAEEQNGGLKSLKDAFDSVKPAALVQGYAGVLKIFQMTQKNMKDLNSWADQNSESSKMMQDSIITWTKAMGAEDSTQINAILDRAIVIAESKNYQDVATLLRRTKGSVTATTATAAITMAGAANTFKEGVDTFVGATTQPNFSVSTTSNTIPGVPNNTVDGRTKSNTIPRSRSEGDRQRILKQRARGALTSNTQSVYNKLKIQFPELKFMGGYSNRMIAGTSVPSKHSYGLAFDVGGSPELMEAMAQWLIQEPTIGNVIYNRKIWNARKGWHAYTGVSPHTDHVHADFQYKKGIRYVPKTQVALLHQGEAVLPKRFNPFSNTPSGTMKNAPFAFSNDSYANLLAYITHPTKDTYAAFIDSNRGLIASVLQNEADRFGVGMSSQQIAMSSVPVIVNTPHQETQPNTVIMPITNNIISNTSAPSINTTNSNMGMSMDPWNMMAGLY